MKPVASIDKCTTCSTCVVHCPVTAATRIFNGPKLTGPSSERFRLFTRGEIEALDYCSNCKNCDIACPCGVQVSTLNMLARAEYCKQHRPPLRDWVLAHGHTLASLTGGLRGVLPGVVQGGVQALLRFGMTNPLTRWVLDRLGVDARAPMPVFAKTSFARLMTRLEQPKTGRQVLFFPGCYINDYDPRTGLDVVWMLNQAGYEVTVPDLGCCGLPLVANGFFDEAAMLARRNVATLMDAVRANVPVLMACTSCSLMFKQDYAELFPDTPEAERLMPAVRDVNEFLLELMDSGAWQPRFRSSPTRLVYHAPCHLRAQGMGSPGLELLHRLPAVHGAQGANVEDARAGCCGIAGSYGFKKGKYDVASSVGQALFDTVRGSGAEYALSECGTCRMQITHHCGLPAMHPVSWLRGLLE